MYTPFGVAGAVRIPEVILYSIYLTAPIHEDMYNLAVLSPPAISMFRELIRYSQQPIRMVKK